MGGAVPGARDRFAMAGKMKKQLHAFLIQRINKNAVDGLSPSRRACSHHFAIMVVQTCLVDSGFSRCCSVLISIAATSSYC